ncbi:MAG: rhamnogalacturonan acetylesterase [Flavobacterium sp.]|nr:rhamnogalacturonan acetylesterase [Flavobacterium sp.]
MKRFVSCNYWLILAAVVLSSFVIKQQQKPTLFAIGDSTVKNGKGLGDGGLWGWADFIKPLFDTNKINIENHALGGTSSRTFQTQGLWHKVLAKVKAGDYVIMQFGHNDSSPINDSSRARGTIKGVSEDSTVIINLLTKKEETVHTYGWYMRKFIADVKAKGATPIICSPIPRNDWKNGKLMRNGGNNYGGWCAEIAMQTGIAFVDLNSITADKYDAMGQEKVTPFFPKEHTHTGKEGAEINAASVVAGLKNLKDCSLATFVK